ncbi:MAG: hypothetical protein HC813_02615 [Planctomycetes bacterium]|nr:hypothetical protein [Planctomycetota bacterium]
MQANHRGFTALEVVMFLLALGIVAALVLVLMPRPVVPGESTEAEMGDASNPLRFEEHKVACLNNSKNLVGLLEVGTGTSYPSLRGPDLILFLVRKGDLAGEEGLGILFCPGDRHESLEKAGGIEAYPYIDLKQQGGCDHLTSYAGRDQISTESAAKKGAAAPKVLTCDDSADHHDGRGFVVGLTGGTVRWRDKVHDYGLDPEAQITVGEASVVEELRCLHAD